MALTNNGKIPTKGQCFNSKNDPVLASIKKECLFITIPHRKYRNELHQDCIIHEPDPKDPQYLAKPGENKLDKRRYVFVQCTNKSPFVYMGELEYCVYYDKGRNQLHLK